MKNLKNHYGLLISPNGSNTIDVKLHSNNEHNLAKLAALLPTVGWNIATIISQLFTEIGADVTQ